MRKLHRLITITMMSIVIAASNNIALASTSHRHFTPKKSLININAVKVGSKKVEKSSTKNVNNDSDKNEESREPITERIKSLLNCAERYKGVPYHFGGANPNGFDCSGYLRYVFKEACGIELPHAADAQYSLGKSVHRNHLKPGDLVFFTTYQSGISHSGIYVGDGKFISATSSSGVSIADMTSGYWGSRYCGAKRVL